MISVSFEALVRKSENVGQPFSEYDSYWSPKVSESWPVPEFPQLSPKHRFSLENNKHGMISNLSDRLEKGEDLHGLAPMSRVARISNQPSGRDGPAFYREAIHA